MTGKTRHLLVSVGLVLLLVALAWVVSSQSAVSLSQVGESAPPPAITGVVLDEHGPLSGATVRVQATTNAALTGDDGRFTLSGLTAGEPVTVTAWAPGYYIAGGDAYLPGTHDVELTLVAHTNEDNAGYAWLSAFAEAGDDANCENCHANPVAAPFTLPFDDWLMDAHSQTAGNVRFLTMYNGSDVHGNQSPRTRHVCTRDYGCFPLPPDPNLPYYGPGYKLDFPATLGNCAACHAPAAAIDAPYGTDPTAVTDVGTEGVACDFCHKVWSVRLDPVTGLPYENMPGVLSFEFRRPPEGHQFFAGPFDDVAPGEDTCSPLQTQSQFCAACHVATFWDTVIYNSFGEWLESAYSDPQTGQVCQDCHMPAGLTDHFARLDKGGHRRDPDTIFSHRMPGAMDEELLRNAVTMTATASLDGSAVVLRVEITNDRTGHHVPTDSPLRHLILLVQTADAEGRPLAQLSGPRVPGWGGVGDPAEGYYAGLPGKAYAKILTELWTEVSPTGAYWNPTRLLSDNRLAASASNASIYTFAASGEGEMTVEVTLLFRRAFIDLMDQKGWEVPDIVMEREVVALAVPSVRSHFPLVLLGIR